MIEPMLLRDCAEVVDCEHKTAPAAEIGIEYAYSIGTPALRMNFINYSEAKPVNKETYQAWTKRKEPDIGDVILAREAPVGGVGMVDKNHKVCLGQRTVLIRAETKKINPYFLFYYLQTNTIQDWMRERSSGSTVAHLNVSDIKAIPITFLPSLEEQNAIAMAIRSLDELGEHDRYLIQSVSQHLIELMGQFLRTKTTIPLENLYEVGLSGVWGEDERSSKAPEEVIVLRGKDLENYFDAIEVDAPRRFLSQKQIDSRKVQVGEIWTAGSGSLGPSIPITAETQSIGTPNNLLYSNFIKRLIPKESKDWYGAAWVSMLKAWKTGEFQNYRTGTAMPNLDVYHMLKEIHVPELSDSEKKEINSLVDFCLSADLRSEIRQCEENKKRMINTLYNRTLTVSA